MNEVHFIRVGRQKKSWVAMMPVVSHRTLMKEIKKHRALMSENVEFDLDNGTIFAGWNTAGRIKVTEVLA